MGLVILITLLVDTACVVFLLHKHAPQEAFDLFESFFRYHFIDQREVQVYFLEIEGKDPPSEFMDRFAGHSPSIKNGSEFISDGFENSDGILFQIDSWRWRGWGWLTRAHAVISGGYRDKFGVSYATYILKREKNRWTLDRVGHGFGIEFVTPQMPPSP